MSEKLESGGLVDTCFFFFFFFCVSFLGIGLKGIKQKLFVISLKYLYFRQNYFLIC